MRNDEGGHAGPLVAISRRGLAPLAHAAGGAWPGFLTAHLDEGPLELLRRVRAEVGLAQAADVPWQRVFDAARPAAAAIWARWSIERRRQFLRHLRARWDVHRHRIAPRIDRRLRPCCKAVSCG